jgi:hypothetical protein
MDLGHAAPDDLAQGSMDDLSGGSIGGTPDLATPKGGTGGCGCVVGGSAGSGPLEGTWPVVSLLLLAMTGLALRPRRRRSS